MVRRMETDTITDIDALDSFTDYGSEAPENAAQFLKSIAHRDRLRVLCSLLKGEQSVSDIETAVGASQSPISQHLGRLKSEGVVASRREGRRILYSISDPTVLGVIELLYQRFCAKEV